jgi:hypothetical protein
MSAPDYNKNESPLYSAFFNSACLLLVKSVYRTNKEKLKFFFIQSGVT